VSSHHVFVHTPAHIFMKLGINVVIPETTPSLYFEFPNFNYINMAGTLLNFNVGS